MTLRNKNVHFDFVFGVFTTQPISRNKEVVRKCRLGKRRQAMPDYEIGAWYVILFYCF